ncbi:hypothetical protein BUALT_Bualt02G0190300 [Buddleja alternifolia]|uniref:Pentatricopeptide repeat-containing protein n=1 Tax=Buddleja alternifolia TaxID=168488 RepID=A0AAV6YC55_9LAMI|nr:hypothetical protein BUALT_Bualt02G0190300 [Buddleja alternifolia]
MIAKSGFETDVSVCNALIDMYADLGKIEESVFLFKRMRLEGVQPNDSTWNAIIAGHATTGDSDGAFEYYSRMVKEGLTADLVT